MNKQLGPGVKVRIKEGTFKGERISEHCGMVITLKKCIGRRRNGRRNLVENYWQIQEFPSFIAESRIEPIDNDKPSWELIESITKWNPTKEVLNA